MYGIGGVLYMGITLGNYFAFFYIYLHTLSCSAGLVWFMDCHSICFIELDQVDGFGGLVGAGR